MRVLKAARWEAFVLALLAALGSATLRAQTTGGLAGRVTDQDGAVLPGVTVTISGPALQGQRVTSTDGGGSYRVALLPPGVYTLVFDLAGFASERRGGVFVNLGKETAFGVELRAATASEEITVVAEAPVVDVASAAISAHLPLPAIENLPTGRNYTSLVQFAPGVSSDANPENQGQTTITVYGSSGAENSFYIDGVNTTGVEYGFQGKELNYEFIQEIEVKAGGYEAEFGKSTGGIINVITKSGGNDFRGDVFGYFDDDSLQRSAATVRSPNGTLAGFSRRDFGFGLGGYAVRDRLWFFAAYDVVDHETTTSLPVGNQVRSAGSKSERDLGSLKLTFNVADGQTLVGTFFQDPRDDSGAINDPEHTLNGEESTYRGNQQFGGRDYALRYDGVLAANWLLSAQVARHEEENSIGPATAAGRGVEFRFADRDFFQVGGFGLTQEKAFERDLFGGAVSWLHAKHEAKLGLEFERQRADVVKFMSGGQRVDIFDNPLDPARPVYRHFYWTTPTATVDNAPLSRLDTDPSHEDTTVYLQDRWRYRPDMTVALGLRWDRQVIKDRFGKAHIDLQDDFAPRLGFSWDPDSDGRAKFYGSYGQYHEKIPMDLVIRSYSFERQARIFNFDPLSTIPDPAAEAALDRAAAILGGATEPTDPNLRSQYISELIMGYERELRPNWAAGVKAIYREYGRVIEDFLCQDDGTYCIGNPGEGIMKEIFTYDYSGTLPAPDPKREFKGVQIDVNKRMSDDWQLMASYLWSRLEGNFDGEYAPFTNVGADPNISAAYDYFDFFTDGRDLTRITNTGPLSNDRRHQFKVSGYWMSPWKVSLGASAYYRSGTPLTRYGYSDGYGRYEFFLSERGAEGRTPALYEADLHAGYPIDVGEVRINVLLDVFNLLDAQRPILLDQRWGFQESDNALSAPANPNYRKPVLRTAPTSLRLGVRISF